MTVNTIIFDLDGTLLDTLEDLADCYNRVLTAQGYGTHKVDDYRYFIGDGGRKCVERALPKSARTDEIIERCLKAQQQDYRTNWHNATREYSGISELLRNLADRNIKLAVLSNKDHAFTRLCIDHFFPTIRFDAVQGFDQDVPHKPDPTGALKIIRELAIRPNEAALLGDTAMDMQTAVRSGMHAIGALWGFRDRLELINAGAEQLIEHPGDLLQLPQLVQGNGECQ